MAELSGVTLKKIVSRPAKRESDDGKQEENAHAKALAEKLGVKKEAPVVEAPKVEEPPVTPERQKAVVDVENEEDWQILLKLNFGLTAKIDAMREQDFEDRNPLLERIIEEWVTRNWPKFERLYGVAELDAAEMRAKQRLLKLRRREGGRRGRPKQS